MTILKNGFARLQRGALRAIGLGDSVTANDSFVSTNGLWREGNGWFESVMREVNSRGYKAFTFVRNAGLGGNTTPQMLARLDADVLAYKPDVVFLMGGTNDILPGAVDADYKTWLNALEKIIVRCLLAGVEVVLATPPAKDAAPAEMRRAVPFLYMMAKHYGLTLIDAFAATADPITGQYKTGYSDDGTHPNQVGIAAIVAASLSPVQADAPLPYLAAVGEQGATGSAPNMIRNGNFQTTTVPPTPDGWAVNTTGATGAITGGGFVYTKTAAGGVYALYGAGIDAGFADGDVLEFNGRLNVAFSGSPPRDGFTLLLDWDGDQVTPINTRVTDGNFGFSQEFVVPVGFGAKILTPQLYVQDTGVYSVYNWTLWNKTAFESVWKPGSSLLA